MYLPFVPGLAGRAIGYRAVFGVFEGGGARGITHVGALKAIEQEKLGFFGVAGSSAGAIVAALIAVGYSADELFKTNKEFDKIESTILGELYAVDLLGRLGWYGFMPFRYPKYSIPLILGAIFCAFYFQFDWLKIAIAIGFCCAFGIPIVRRGFFSSRRLSAFVNEKLRETLFENLDGDEKEKLRKQQHLVTFGDLRARREVTLHIIASDISTGQLVRFNHQTPDVVVADAVVASAAIPFFFQPPAIRCRTAPGKYKTFRPMAVVPNATNAREGDHGIFVDGGLVSNLPVWSVREEKRARERFRGGAPIPILALSLSDAPIKARDEIGLLTPVKAWLRQFSLAYTYAVLKTGIFGSQQIVRQFMPDVVALNLPSNLGALGFNCGRADAIKAYRMGLDNASERLGNLARYADIRSAVLERVRADAESKLKKEKLLPPRGSIRVSIVEAFWEKGPFAGTTEQWEEVTFRVTATAGMTDATDDRLELDHRNGAAPACIQTGERTFKRVRGQSATDLMMTKYEHALLKGKVDSIMCEPVPIEPGKSAKSGNVRQALCIDSGADLTAAFQDAGFINSMSPYAMVVSPGAIASGMKRSNS